MTITIASTVTNDWIRFLYVLMGSIKGHKKTDTTIEYHVFVPYTADKDSAYYDGYFGDLQSDTFHVHLMDAQPLVQRVGSDLPGAHIMYIRYLFPEVFPDLDRILFLDADVLCYNSGIEDIWETDITDCYAAVAADPVIERAPECQAERYMVGSSKYFNDGVSLLNLKYMRETGMDKRLATWLTNWDYSRLQPNYFAQTLANYLFRDHVRWFSSLYNNMLLAAWGYSVNAHKDNAAELGYAAPLDTVKDTVFLHFCDHCKPWLETLPNPEDMYPYIQESRTIWAEAEKAYGKISNHDIQCTAIKIASAFTVDRLSVFYVLLNSIKHNKKPDTTVDYYVFVPYATAKGQDYYENYFAELQDDMFHVHVLDILPVLQQMGDLYGGRIYYTRCMFPMVFPELDRLLYLDADVLCCRAGIEEFWETDLTDCYAAVVPDPPIMWADRYKFERENTGLSKYFNSGVMLFNFTEIRKQGMDAKLVEWCRRWDNDKLKPYHHDQTLMNWLFQDHVKWLPWLYNNQVLTSWGYKVASYEQQAAEDGYKTPLDTVKDTLFLHFCDHVKPWASKLPYPEVTYPYLKEARMVWRDAVTKYAKQPDAMQDTITIATTATLDRKENVYILMNGIRENKRMDTLIMFYLFVPKTEIPEFQRYLTGIPSETFKVTIMDVDWFADKVDTRGTIRNHLYYARCLFPQVFLTTDKLLYMDIDMACIGPGIEELWNEDIEGCWVGACIDPTWQYCPYFSHDPINTGTDHYFNNGMMLMNLKQIRKDGKDKEFAEWCLHWDKTKLVCHCFDQTLCNYLLKDKVRLLNTRYNNSLLVSLGVAEDAYALYMEEQGYDEPLDSLRDAVFLHFCGSKKPWDQKALACSKDEYPFKDEAVDLWRQIKERFGKK